MPNKNERPAAGRLKKKKKAEKEALFETIVIFKDERISEREPSLMLVQLPARRNRPFIQK